MTPGQEGMCITIAHKMVEFYKDPENERRFQEWKERRHQPTTAKSPAAPPQIRRTKRRRNHTTRQM